MKTNETPLYDMSDNPTECCPRFKPEPWDNQQLDFKDKRFVRATTRGLFHIPLNMNRVFNRTFKAIEEADALDVSQTLVLSRDPSPWQGEHLFAVTKDVPGQDMVSLSGDYRTKVFEGPYRMAPKWMDAFEDELERQGLDEEEMYLFYMTCPKCAKTYGKNYVVAVARVEPDEARPH
ncbi:MAG: hypothetical protein QNI84_03130 [Henriciella sp.]|nr:hypothetical protein [Henriciella sp.]